MLMDLFIETLTGVSFELRVSPAETVMSIKSKIQRAEGIPVTQQHLIWQNDELDDHRRLRDYSISGGSTLRLVLGLRGGPLNAHRIPPLRLTPIQLTSSATPVISRINRVSTDRSKRTQRSRLTLPALSTQGVITLPQHSPRAANPMMHKAIELTDSGEHTKNLSVGSKPTDLTSAGVATKVESEISANLLATSFSELTTSGVSPPDVSVKADTTSRVSHSAPVSQEISADKRSVIQTDKLDAHSAVSIRRPNSSGHVSDIFLNRSSVLLSAAHEPTLQPQDPSAESALSRTLSRPSTVRADVENVDSHMNSTKLRNTDQTDNETADTGRSARLGSPPLGYPPLINPTSHFHSTLNSCDLSSYWRLYEPREVTAIGESTMLRNRFPLVGMTDPNNDGSSSSAPGSDRDSPSTTYNLVAPTSDSVNVADKRIEDFPFGTSDVSSAAAATILAGLLSVTGDHLALPCQTSGSERGFSRTRYPYHWPKQRASPLLEETTEETPHMIESNGCLWDTGGTEEDCEAVVSGTLFGIDTARDGDDLDGEDDEGLNEEGDDDDDDVDSVGTKGAYACGLDDDDSLADLEDYLFYYRTGDLLFGPPIASIYPPYSCHYTGQDCFATDNWRAGFEADFGISSTRERRREASSKQQGSAWHQECTQLAEKVQDLKARMQEARVRRQSRQRQTGNDLEQNLTSKQGETSPSSQTKTKDHTSPSVPDNSDNSHTSNGTGTTTTVVENRLSTPARVNPATITSTLFHEPRPRQRRFGTVTPPELSFLMLTHSDDSPPESKLRTSDQANLGSVTDSPPLSNEASAGPRRADEFASSSPLIAIQRTISSSGGLSKNGTEDKLDTTVASKDVIAPDHQLAPTLISCGSRPPVNSKSLLSPRSLPQRSKNLSAQPIQFLPTLTGIPTSPPSSGSTRLLSAGEGRARVCSRLGSSGGGGSGIGGSSSKTCLGKTENQLVLRPLPTPPTPGKGDAGAMAPRSPPKPAHSPNSLRRKRCALCLRKIGIVNSYSCRCGRNFCSRHRYAEVHACPFDYKAEARRTLIDSNPVVTAPKLPKI